jgi:hypothetical protein
MRERHRRPVTAKARVIWRIPLQVFFNLFVDKIRWQRISIDAIANA